MTQAGGGNDRKAFPEFYAEYDIASGLGKRLGNRFVANGDITYVGQRQVAARHRESRKHAAERGRKPPAPSFRSSRRPARCRRQERILSGRGKLICSRSPTP